MLSLSCFKAGKGDSFLLSWHNGQHRLLIDAGSSGAYRFFGPKVRDFGALDAVLVTHADYDHVGGFFKWLGDREYPFHNEVPIYMNTAQLLLVPDDSGKVAVEHGIELEQLLLQRGIRPIPVYLKRDDKTLIEIHGLRANILSPSEGVICELLKKWKASDIYQDYLLKQLEQDDKVSGKDKTLRPSEAILADPPKPHAWEDDLMNASSIAFIAEHQGNRLLFLGDSNPSLICDELKRLGYTSEQRLQVDLVKISHHGSKHNTTQDLLERISCNKYLISTDGSGPYYHPARETLILIATYGRRTMEEVLDIYSNYELPLDRLLTVEERQTLKLRFEMIDHLEFPDK